ncbi:MAG: hypothetical protein OCD76_17460 [Reichenbachiella sp.]
MENWTVLGEYLDKEALVNAEAILNGNKISFQVKSPESHLNSGFGQATSQPFVLEVLLDQFEEAKKLIHNEDENAAIVEVPLEGYSIEELKEIVLNPEDWHKEFVNRATEELTRQGENVSAEEIEKTKHQKVEETQAGIEPSMTIYYFMWFFAIMGGYIGIISGYFYWKGTTKALDGKKYYMYTEKYRGKGYYMFMLGLISAVLQTYLFIKWA